MCRFVRWLASVACASALLTACSSGGGGGGESAPSLSGTVLGWTSVPLRGDSPRGLAGVVVRVDSITSKSSAQATTDGQGNFIMPEPPTGLVRLHLDGTGVTSGTFPDLELSLIVGDGASNLSRPILLP